MAARRSASFLYLQLGQEVIYLLLAIALSAALIMASIFLTYDPPKPDPPPIIILSEADGYYFAIGSAQLSEEFEQRLAQRIIPDIVRLNREYQADVLEIIGHTDEVPILSLKSNLDEDLLPFLSGQDGLQLQAADNTGLGMARAAAVGRLLLADPRLKRLRILPLSAGQAIEPGDALADAGDTMDDQTRRRIEMRLRRTR